MGVVEEARNDEPQLGRVKVRIYGIHGTRDQVPVADLPYAQVLVPTTEPGVSGLGRNPMLTEGATVFGIFLDGKYSQLPLVLGSIPVIEVPSIEQINAESNDISLNNALKQITGSLVGGTAGFGTGGVSGMKSALAQGLDGFEWDPVTYRGRHAQIAWEWLSLSGKYDQPVIAGMIGNFLTRSGSGNPIDIDPARIVNEEYGIAGWKKGTPRLLGLFAYAEARQKDWKDLFLQLEYVQYELATLPEVKSAELKRKKTPTEAALHFQRNYLRAPFTNPVSDSPIDGDKARVGEAKTVAFARTIFNQFTRKNTE